MKSFQVALVLVVACAAVALAEPPRYRSNRFIQFQRQEQDPQEGSASGPYPPAMPPAEAPYPPSNWKPSGRLFALPARQTQPKETYGPPPAEVYGPPTTPQPAEPEPTTTEAEVETTEENVTTEPLSETVDVEDNAQEQPQSERLTQQQQLQSGGPGFYYVQLPQLQQPQVAQQQVYLAPQVQTAQLKALPLTQPLVVASQPLVYSSGYYVSTQQTW